MSTLAKNSYGKTLVRVVKVFRRPDEHNLKELTVECLLIGPEFETSYTKADNSKVIPTDTVKNTIYILAQQHPLNTIEEFGVHVANHFLNTYSHVEGVKVTIQEHIWNRMPVGEAKKGHSHSFTRGTEKKTCRVKATRKGAKVASGIDDLTVLKTTGSGFENYHKDKYTTLKPTDDRILCTSVRCSWNYNPNVKNVDYDRVWQGVRDTIFDIFALQFSPGVQATVWEIGRKVIEKFPEIDDVSLILPNKHVFTVDLSRFGLKNTNEIYQPLSDPSGLIKGTIKRQASKY